MVKTRMNRHMGRGAGVFQRRLLVVLIMTIMLLPALAMGPAPALREAEAEGEYDFELKREDVTIDIRRDGGIDIHYYFEFTNYGKLDGVDVGLPNRFYDKDSASAAITVDNYRYKPDNIRKSPYVYIGLAVEFSQPIMDRIQYKTYGKDFSMEFEVTNPHMVYENELKDGTVGIRFRPTWFDPEFQRGATDVLTCKVYFPEGFSEISQSLYLSGNSWDEYDIYMDSATGRMVGSWNATNVSPSDQEGGKYDIGVGFPKAHVDKYYEHDIWEKLGNVWYGIVWYSFMLAPCFIIAAVIAGFIMMDRNSKRKAARDYFEPKLSVAGAGPRRDLSAVEAAVLLERPINVVATMILFGLTRKGFVEVDQFEKPMKLIKRASSGDFRYEVDYLDAIQWKGTGVALGEAGTLDKDELKSCLVQLVKDTQKKLEGFDFDATKRYYKSICNRAWREVKQAQTPEEFAADFENYSGWMLLDKNFEERAQTEYQGLPWYSGHYYHHHHYYWHSRHSSGAGSSFNAQQMVHSYTSSLKSASNHMVSNISSLATGVTRITNPGAFSSSSGSGGGGGGCACACACACAGGGR